MRVVLDDGTELALGTTEAAPTIGITDYSRRVTDDFGVTTVVERGFARRMSVRLALPFAEVDTLQRRLAALRATPARWIADEEIGWLAARGFFKDFELDLAVPPLSFCTLTVEGLTETEVIADAGADPAPAGQLSTLHLLQPVALTEAMLVSSSVAEDDAPAWSPAIAYPSGARVLRGHRVYESLSAGNTGKEPSVSPGAWLLVGPSNRWAMFDRALGTGTTSPTAITVGIDAGTIDAVALLDVVGSTVRVQAPGYDQTLPAGPGAVTFLDLPPTDGLVTVTISGDAPVSVGTLLIGRLVSLGVTEASPTAGITDYSRKEVDDFGQVTIVQRAWAKRMQARAIIRTDAVDQVANNIAAVRAMPSLWIGDAGTDTLTIYGFFKDFAVEVGESVSKLSLTIEGLSQAAPIPVQLPPTVAWPDITDPTGTKPDDNATDGTPIGSPIGDRLAEEVLDDLDLSSLMSLATATIAGTWRAETDEVIYAADGKPIRQQIEQIGVKTEELELFVSFLKEVNASAGTSKFVFSADADGTITGIVGIAGGGMDRLAFMSSRFYFVDNSGENPTTALSYEDGVWKLKSIEVDTLKINSVQTDTVSPFALRRPYATELVANKALPFSAGTTTIASLSLTKERNDSDLEIDWMMRMRPGGTYAGYFELAIAGTVVDQVWYWGPTAEINNVRSARNVQPYRRRFTTLPGGPVTLQLRFTYWGHDGGTGDGFIEAGSIFAAEEIKR